MSPKDIVEKIEGIDKGIRVIGVFSYGNDYLVSYSKNGQTLLDPFYLVSGDGKRVNRFNPSSDPIGFSEKVGKKPIYLRKK